MDSVRPNFERLIDSRSGIESYTYRNPFKCHQSQPTCTLLFTFVFQSPLFRVLNYKKSSTVMVFLPIKIAQRIHGGYDKVETKTYFKFLASFLRLPTLMNITYPFAHKYAKH